MRFQVPQFIEVEDKIVGPLTIFQFIYLAGGVGTLVALWLLLPTTVAILIGGPFALLGSALAFLKVNNRPFILVMQHAIEYLFRDKIYIWDKQKRVAEKKEEEPAENPSSLVPATTSSKLKELAWGLDVNNRGRMKKNI